MKYLKNSNLLNNTESDLAWVSTNPNVSMEDNLLCV